MKTVVLGLGNPLLTDDGVGIQVARQVAACSQSCDGLAVAEASLGGLRLLDIIAGCDRAVIVDAIQTQGGVPGDIYRLDARDLRRSFHSGSTHDLSLAGAMALGRALGTSLPTDEATVIIAVEVADVLTFGEECTPAVAAAIPRAVEAVLSELQT
jgi:hydrogenase maturation protease